MRLMLWFLALPFWLALRVILLALLAFATLVSWEFVPQRWRDAAHQLAVLPAVQFVQNLSGHPASTDSSAEPADAHGPGILAAGAKGSPAAVVSQSGGEPSIVGGDEAWLQYQQSRARLSAILASREHR